MHHQEQMRVKNQVLKPLQEGVRSTVREVQVSTAAWVEQASTAALEE
jgi:hypothetical protein